MAQTLQFIVVTNSSPELSAEDQSVIKKHVMKDIGRARRRYKLPTRHCSATEKNCDSVSEPTNRHRVLPPKSRPTFLNNRQAKSVDGPKSLLEVESRLVHWRSTLRMSPGAGVADPFMSTPVPLDAETGPLIRYIHDDSHAAFKLFREYWYPLAIQDSASMYFALAIVAQHRLTMYCHASKRLASQEMQCALYYDSGIKHLQTRLSDPTLSIGEGTITAMLLFICDHKSVHTAADFRRHMDAIHIIIMLRGGLQTLASNKKLRLLLFWVDTLGSAVLNQIPRFPAPEQYLPRYDNFIYGKLRPRLPQTIAKTWHSLFPSHRYLIEVLDDLCALCAMVEGEAHTGKPLQDPRFTGFYTMPLVHRLFSLKNEDSATLQEKMVFESAKEGAFIFLQLLRYLIAQRYPCLKQPFIEYIDSGRSKLMANCIESIEIIMLGHQAVWIDLLPVKCWVLTMVLNASSTIGEVPSSFQDLEDLADRPDYDALNQSMGLLMNNLATEILH